MRRWLWLVFGLLLVGAGVVIVLTAPHGPADYGWFAYTPLDDDPDWYLEWDAGGDGPTTAALVLTRQHVVGYAVLGLGVLVVATGAAYRLGRRRGDQQATV